MKIKVAIAVITLIFIGGNAWWFMGRHDQINHTEHKSTTGVTKKTSQYVCPMHPQITSDKAGICPICGMDLVQLEDKEEHENHDHDHKSNGKGEWETLINLKIILTKKRKPKHQLVMPNLNSL